MEGHHIFLGVTDKSIILGSKHDGTKIRLCLDL